MKNRVSNTVRTFIGLDGGCGKRRVGCAPRTKITIFLAAVFSFSIVPVVMVAQSSNAVSDNTKPNVKAVDLVQLALGVDVEREILGEQKHLYKIAALANQFIHITVE